MVIRVHVHSPGTPRGIAGLARRQMRPRTASTDAARTNDRVATFRQLSLQILTLVAAAKAGRLLARAYPGGLYQAITCCPRCRSDGNP